MTTTVNVSAGVLNIVGNTIIQTTGATNATNVTGGTLTINPASGPTPGPDTITTVNGNALHANGGTINVTNPGLTIQTQGGLGTLANGAASTVTISNGASINSTGVGDALVAIGGGTINASGVVITATGSSANAHGAIAESGGIVNLHAGTSIARLGSNSVGIGASGTGSRVTADAIIPVTMNGNGGLGVYMHDAGQVALVAGSTLEMNGTNSVGVTVDNTISAAGAIGSGLTVNFNTEGAAGQAGGTGVVAVNGGSIVLNDLAVRGPGTAAGVWARPGSSITLTGDGVIEINSLRNPTQYTLATPYLATVNGSIGSSFSVTGAIPAAGLRAEGGTVTSTGTSVTVTSSGIAAAGAYAGAGGLVDMTDNNIVTTGANTFGIRIDSGQVIGRASSVSTTGGGAAMFINFGPGVIRLTDTVVTATGPNTSGLASLNGTPASTNILNLTGGSLTSAEEFAIVGQGPLTVTTAGGAVVRGTEGLLYAADQSFFPQPTVVNLTALGASQLFGDAFAEPLSVANIDLLTASRWTGAAFDVTNVATDPTSSWIVTGNSVVTQTVGNAGLVQLTPPIGDPALLSSYKTLTTQDYVGGGGTLGLNTFLGLDNSPSDRLIIDGGSATGTSGVIVQNTTGRGAVTLANGILVVDAVNGGTTIPDAFHLGRPVVAGPYEYLLYRGSVDASGPDNWYLRSTLDCTVPGAPSPPCPDPPPPDPNPGPPSPHIRPEVSIAVVNPSLGLLYGRSLLDTLHERIGDRVPRPEEATPSDPVPATARLKDEVDLPMAPAIEAADDYGVWGRIIGVRGQHRGDPIGVYGSGPSFDYGLAALQAGIDLYYVQDVDDNGDVTTGTAGVYGAVGMASADVEHHLLGIGDFPGGTASLNAYSLGGYWTRYGAGGWYLDGALQGTIYDFTIDSHRGLAAASTGGFGIAASLEAGYPIGLGEGWILEPQAQAIFQSIAIDDFSDSGADIRYSKTQSLTGRIGARLARTVYSEDDPSKERPMTIWARANLWHEFLEDPTTEFSSATGFIPFTADIRDTWIEVGVGADIKFDHDTSLYGALSYETSLDGATTAFEGKVGLRVKW